MSYETELESWKKNKTLKLDERETKICHDVSLYHTREKTVHMLFWCEALEALVLAC